LVEAGKSFWCFNESRKKCKGDIELYTQDEKNKGKKPALAELKGKVKTEGRWCTDERNALQKSMAALYARQD